MQRFEVATHAALAAVSQLGQRHNRVIIGGRRSSGSSSSGIRLMEPADCCSCAAKCAADCSAVAEAAISVALGPLAACWSVEATYCPPLPLG